MTEQAPDPAGPHNKNERLPAVWPWLLIPLVALALFFSLHRVRGTAPEEHAASAQEGPQ